ncbi:MAG: YhbY family RNA-binding protein [Nanoarchaeota archaeon]|nr:YhbY family RNA-binding protein [Nanoarchaeota archaeon]
MAAFASFQMGKSGLTDQFMQALRNAFKTHRIVKVSFLKSSTRDKAEIKQMAEEMCKKLEDKEQRYDFTTIGFKATLRRFRKRGETRVSGAAKTSMKF